MKWEFKRSTSVTAASERIRRETERWLDRALTSGASFPHIPLRRVDHGGFDSLRANPRGPEIAERWWRTALNKTPLNI